MIESNSETPFSAEIKNCDENILDGKFFITGKLGEGLIANVYKCYDLEENKYYALKLFRDLVVRRFGKPLLEKEVEYMQKANVLGISTKLHFASSEGKRWDFLTKRFETNKNYMVIELMEGGELFDLLSSRNSFTIEQSLFFFKQLTEALYKLKKLNIAHRDLKMENIVLDKNYNLKLIDFGQATNIFDEKGEKVAHKEFIGTEKYRAPELNEGLPYYADQVDVFSLGVILFSMLAGKKPFNKATQSDPYYKHIAKQDYNNYWKIAKTEHFPKEIKELLEGMLCYNYKSRMTIEDIMKSEFLKGSKDLSEEDISEMFRTEK